MPRPSGIDELGHFPRREGFEVILTGLDLTVYWWTELGLHRVVLPSFWRDGHWSPIYPGETYIESSDRVLIAVATPRACSRAGHLPLVM